MLNDTRHSIKRAYAETILVESKASRLKDLIKAEIAEIIILRHDTFSDLDVARDSFKRINAIKADDRDAKEKIVKILTALHDNGAMPKTKAAKEISEILKRLA